MRCEREAIGCSESYGSVPPSRLSTIVPTALEHTPAMAAGAGSAERRPQASRLHGLASRLRSPGGETAARGGAEQSAQYLIPRACRCTSAKVDTTKLEEQIAALGVRDGRK